MGMWKQTDTIVQYVIQSFLFRNGWLGLPWLGLWWSQSLCEVRIHLGINFVPEHNACTHLPRVISMCLGGRGKTENAEDILDTMRTCETLQKQIPELRGSGAVMQQFYTLHRPEYVMAEY